MNKATLLTGVLLLLVGTAATGQTPERPSFLPLPQHVQVDASRLTLRDGLRIVIASSAAARLHEIAEILRDGLRDAGIAAVIETSAAAPPEGAVHLTLTPAPSAAGAAANPEAYTLKIARSIEVSATDPRGLLWGVQTLLQSIDSSRPGSLSVARGEIADQPAYAWRAVMLDSVRSFLDLDFLRRTIRVMSAYKLNILHLHLTDDHAWRFETKAFPLCNPPGEPLYTQAELKELVAFAQRHGVEIVPEFDFPGHAHAAVAAYPELDCEGKARPMDEAIFCAGKPFTWEFMDKVLAEAAEIFPSRYIHLGADEPFAVKRWNTCPFCQARMKARGVTTTTGLYHTFVTDLDELAKRHGKKLMVWNDAITPGVEPMPPKDILLDAWVDPNKVKALAEAGYTLVNSTNRPLYISSYGQRQGFPLSAVWQWTPRVFGAREARSSDVDLKSTPLPEQTQILGGQVSAWATEQRLMERRLYPRLLAVAETLWSGAARGDYADFSARLAAGQMERLHRLGVPDDEALPVETIFGKADEIVRAMDASTNFVMRYKKDYRDFILTFERQAPENTGNTGFVVRSSGDPLRGFVVRSSPPPGMKIVANDASTLKGWNQFELVARGRLVTLTINGYLAWSVVDPSPQSGSIALVGDGAGYEVKNVRVRSLDSPGAASPKESR